MNTTSPIEYLVAFGATFLGGVIATVAFQQYIKYVRNESKVA